MSIDSLRRRLDKVSSRTPTYTRTVTDFELARWIAWTINRPRYPGASPQQMQQAQALASMLGLAEPFSVERVTHPFDFA